MSHGQTFLDPQEPTRIRAGMGVTPNYVAGYAGLSLWFYLPRCHCGIHLLEPEPFRADVLRGLIATHPRFRRGTSSPGLATCRKRAMFRFRTRGLCLPRHLLVACVKPPCVGCGHDHGSLDRNAYHGCLTCQLKTLMILPASPK